MTNEEIAKKITKESLPMIGERLTPNSPFIIANKFHDAISSALNEAEQRGYMRAEQEIHRLAALLDGQKMRNEDEI